MDTQIIASRIATASSIALICDYDGTLTPIVSQPDLALLSEETRQLLAALSQLEGVYIAIISGRALDDIESKVGLDVIYAGNHGLEIDGPLGRFREPRAAKNAPLLQAMIAALHKQLDGIEGLTLENKGLTASVHYRRAHPEHEETIRLLVSQAVAAHSDAFILREGKKVLEIRPAVDWHKGSAARWIVDRLPKGTLPICLGDDTTDEDMFVALAGGLTISIGRRENTSARFHVASVEEAVQILFLVRREKLRIPA